MIWSFPHCRSSYFILPSRGRHLFNKIIPSASRGKHRITCSSRSGGRLLYPKPYLHLVIPPLPPPVFIPFEQTTAAFPARSRCRIVGATYATSAARPNFFSADRLPDRTISILRIPLDPISGGKLPEYHLNIHYSLEMGVIPRF
jgi:hypothetical protein